MWLLFNFELSVHLFGTVIGYVLQMNCNFVLCVDEVQEVALEPLFITVMTKSHDSVIQCHILNPSSLFVVCQDT